MKELKIGETINYNGYILKAEKAIDESIPCKGCFFDDFLDCTKEVNITGYCGSLFRGDRTNIIFKEIKIMKEITIKIPDNYELVKEGDAYKIKELSYPKTWEEFCKMYPTKDCEYYITSDSTINKPCRSFETRISDIDRNLCTSKKEAEAFLALMQLRQLRKAWVGNWEYEVSAKTYSHVIVYNKCEGLKGTTAYCSHPLSFPIKEMAEEFFSCFRDLLEKAKILL